jgi:hypothetical protein
MMLLKDFTHAGVSVLVDRYCPTWGPEPTRREIWTWRLRGRWLGERKPQRERVFFEMPKGSGKLVMSPENFEAMKNLSEGAKR